MSGKHLPYRGEPQPHYPKRPRQVRNLRLERVRDVLSIGIPLVLSLAVMIWGFFYPQDEKNTALGIMFMLGLIGLVFTASIADGAKSINRFRKGYDFDSSIREKDKDEDKDRKDRNEDE
jgi:hypothetical protein